MQPPPNNNPRANSVDEGTGSAKPGKKYNYLWDIEATVVSHGANQSKQKLDMELTRRHSPFDGPQLGIGSGEGEDRNQDDGGRGEGTIKKR
eukprot:9254130-Pyramimonas_sp.AAC.1